MMDWERGGMLTHKEARRGIREGTEREFERARKGLPIDEEGQRFAAARRKLEEPEPEDEPDFRFEDDDDCDDEDDRWSR